MDLSTKMATFPRHGHLVMGFFPNILELFKNNEVYPLQEEQILVYKGKRYSGEESLIDVEKIVDMQKFRGIAIEELGTIQPDFLFFKDNAYVQSLNTLKTAGVPDLVVEVWSESNDLEEREFKYRVYSSSGKCEHWYLTQNSNEVECWLGKEKLKTQTLKRILKTSKGVEFDLMYLAL